MTKLNKRIGVVALGLVMLFVAAMPASAQNRYRRYRDRDNLSTKEKVAIIGGGAAVGAVLGGLLGGKKGAIIGGVAGGGAGTGYVVLKDRQNNDRYGYYEGRNNRDYRYRRGAFNNRSRYYNDTRYYNDNNRYNVRTRRSNRRCN